MALDGEYDSEHDSGVDMHMEEDVDAQDGVDLVGNVHMERDGDEEEEAELEKDEEQMEKNEKDEEEEQEEDKDEDDSKEPQTIGQEAVLNTSSDDADTMVDVQAIVLSEQGQETREDLPRPWPLEPAQWPPSTEPCLQPWTPETHPLGGLEDLGLVTPQKHRPVVPSLWEPKAAGNTSDVDVD